VGRYLFLQRIGNRGIRLGTLFERAAARHPANVVLLDTTWTPRRNWGAARP